MRQLFIYSIFVFLLSCGTKQVNLNDFKNEPLSSECLPTLLVQVHRTSAGTGSLLIEMKRALSEEIGDSLWNRKIGVANGGGFQPASFDIHFRVLNTEQALPVIVEILKKRNLDARTVIFERRFINPNNADEKVIYPDN